MGNNKDNEKLKKKNSAERMGKNASSLVFHFKGLADDYNTHVLKSLTCMGSWNAEQEFCTCEHTIFLEKYNGH